MELSGRGQKWRGMLQLFVVYALCVAVARPQTLVKVGEIRAPHAAFVTLVDNSNSGHTGVTHAPGGARDGYTVMVSGFNPIPLLHDFVYQVDGVARSLSARTNFSMTARQISTEVTWPNEIHAVPDAVFKRSGMVVVAGGFLVPLKDHGSLTLFDLTATPATKHVLTGGNSDDTTWFYHRVQWKDMNGDGLLDMVTCRAKKHLIGSAEGQLVWFEHPQQGALTQPWHSHVIANGPDIFFTLTSLPTPNGVVDCVITAGFFSKSLNVYWTSHPQKRWDDASMIHHRVIDNTIGAAFDVQVVDLNVDGTLDLLVTNNAIADASLFAYTVPKDFRTGNFPRRTLATGYSSRTSGMGHGAPGTAIVVFPQTHTTGKPWILVSGDDDGRAHLLKPTSNNAADWSYQQTSFLDVGTSTVGGIAAGDVDGDGFTEVFVPSFSDGVVHVFSFRPESTVPIG